MSYQKKLKDLIKSGYSQTELGKAIGLSQPAISKILRGATKAPNAESAKKLELLALHKREMKKARG